MGCAVLKSYSVSFNADSENVMVVLSKNPHSLNMAISSNLGT